MTNSSAMPPHRTAPTDLVDRSARRFGRTARASVVAMILVVTASACGSSNPSNSSGTATTPANSTLVPSGVDPTTPSEAGTYAVGRATRTFVDDSRVTAAHGGETEKPERTLDTLILYPVERTPAADPTEDAPPLEGSWPTIVFGHGSTMLPEDYLAKLSFWASAGYVIVAPEFPLSKEGTPGGTSYVDYPNQTGDESFLIDQVTTDDTAPLHLSSLIDADRIGLGGQSFGAITALGTVASACCADKRVRVATSFAGVWLPYPSGSELAEWAAEMPILFVHGDEDPTLPYDQGRNFFERLGAPGGFLTLVGSGHDAGYFGSTQNELEELVSTATLAFYDQYLKDGADATPIIEALVAEVGPDVASFTPSP